MTDEHTIEIEVPVLWPDNTSLFLLWLAYLEISPSYKLAHLCRTDALDKDHPVKLPKDFDRVLSFYDDFGDIYGVEFEDWWSDVGRRYCWDIGEPPRVMEVATLEHGVLNHSDASTGIDQFLDQRWIAQGMQNSVLISIPLGLPKAKISKQIFDILERQPDEKKKISRYEAKHRLAVKQNNGKTLMNYLRTVISKAAYPGMELWRIGADAYISETYSPELDANQPIKVGEAIYDRMMLTILTSRALGRAKMISENAARGIFPSHKKCMYALDLDLAEINNIHPSEDE
jgi:hypothetical protein